jgi:hypothetical protein
MTPQSFNKPTRRAVVGSIASAASLCAAGAAALGNAAGAAIVTPATAPSAAARPTFGRDYDARFDVFDPEYMNVVSARISALSRAEFRGLDAYKAGTHWKHEFRRRYTIAVLVGPMEPEFYADGSYSDRYLRYIAGEVDDATWAEWDRRYGDTRCMA